MISPDALQRSLCQQFQRDVAVQHLIVRPIDHTHTAFADLRQYSVMVERLSDHRAVSPLSYHVALITLPCALFARWSQSQAHAASKLITERCGSRPSQLAMTQKRDRRHFRARRIVVPAITKKFKLVVDRGLYG